MREPLTTTLLLELIGKLHIAFPRTIGEKNPAMMAEVYRNGLRGVSGEAVRDAVERCIQKDEYFPKVSRIREYAAHYDKVRTVDIRGQEGWDECGICGARAKHVFVEGSTEMRLVMEHNPGPHGLRKNSEEGAA